MPVVEGERLVGILTDRDMRFERNPDRIVREVMTPLIAWSPVHQRPI